MTLDDSEGQISEQELVTISTPHSKSAVLVQRCVLKARFCSCRDQGYMLYSLILARPSDWGVVESCSERRRVISCQSVYQISVIGIACMTKMQGQLKRDPIAVSEIISASCDA